MVIEQFYGNPKSQEFSEIIDQYSLSGINSIQTSTIPLLQYWKNTDKCINYLFEKLGLTSDKIKICYEYPTRSYKSNKCSMTDIMIIGNNFKIAIEGKYTEVEHKYETIEEWNDSTENKKNVITHWIDIITPFLEPKEPVYLEKLNTFPYQLLHRIASACYDKPRFAFVIYQIFYDDNTSDAMEEFIKKLGNSIKILHFNKEMINIFVLKIKIVTFKEVKKEDVLHRLKTENIYTFGEEEIFKKIV
jgi:hypothetical protein